MAKSYAKMAFHPAFKSVGSPTTRVVDIAWQPGEGEVVACVTSGGEGRIIDMEKSEETGVIEFGEDTNMRAVTWSPAGDLLATRGIMEAVIWYSTGTRKVTLQSEDPNDIPMPPMKFNPSGDKIVLAREYGFSVFDVRTGHSLQYMDSDSYPIDIIWKNELEIFCTSRYNIIHWSVGQERQLRELTGHHDSLAFNSKTGILASGGDDCTVRLWDNESAVSTATLTGHTGYIFELAWHPQNAKILASCDLYCEVRVWDTAAKVTLHVFEGLEEYPPGAWDMNHSHMTFSPDGRHLAVLGEDVVVVREANTGSVEAVCKLDEAAGANWSPRGDKLAVMSDERVGFVRGGRVGVFNLQNIVEMKLEVMSMMQVASCLERNIRNKDKDTEEVLKNLHLPKTVIEGICQYLK